MSQDERRLYKIRLAMFKRGDLAKRPRRPSAPSKAGEPPRTPTGLLRKHIYYELDFPSHEVAVGPALLPGSITSKVPSVMEYGGLAQDQPNPGRIAARPYMQPALDQVTPKLPGMWNDIVSDTSLPAPSGALQSIFS